MGIGIVSTYPPRQCGIATVAQHLQANLARLGEHAPVVSMVKRPGGAASPEVIMQIRQEERRDYAAAAKALNAAAVDAVIVQHEFSIYGGNLGGYVLELLGALRKPAITVCHTIVAAPSRGIRQALDGVAARSSRIVVVSQRDRAVLCRDYAVDPAKVVHIPLGAPEPPAGTPAEWKERLGLSNRELAMTFGLLGPEKGLETVVEAMGLVAPSRSQLTYLIVGATHPRMQRGRGEAYRDRLKARAAALGVADNVRFVDRYLGEAELLAYLQACDLYVTPYPQQGRGASLTTVYAAFLGKPILTTPFDYAWECLGNGGAHLFPFGDAGSLADGLRFFMEEPKARERLGAAAKARTQELSWANVSRQYLELVRSLT